MVPCQVNKYQLKWVNYQSQLNKLPIQQVPIEPVYFDRQVNWTNEHTTPVLFMGPFSLTLWFGLIVALIHCG